MKMINLKYSEILKLNKNLEKKDKTSSYNISLLSNITIHQSKEVIEYSIRKEGINANITLGEYDNIIQDSKKQSNNSAVIIFWELAHLFEGFHYKVELLSEIEVVALEKKLKSEIIFVLENLKSCQLVVFNKFSSLLFTSLNIHSSRLNLLKNKLNEYLESLESNNIKLANIDDVISYIGYEKSFDLRYFYSAKAPYSIDFFKAYATYIKPLLMSINGKSKKILIFDCDNTLWKGILGEDGFDGIEMSSETENGKIFQEVQSIASYLSKQGILIGLCSKNNLDDVNNVLFNNEFLVLKDSQIAIKKINWSDKASNLLEISKELNITLQDFVFIDDSEFECNLIKELLPEVTVLQVPKKLINYSKILRDNLGLFYKFSNTYEDSLKTQMYHHQKQRSANQVNFSSIDDYLRSLDLKLKIYKNNSKQISRIAQMSQKTNQFNLTTKRYAAGEINKMMLNKKIIIYTFSVEDKYGDSGVTGLSSIKKDKDIAEIDSFLLSCRVIGRNLEYAFLDYFIQDLKKQNVKTLNAKFIKSNKNIQVNNFYDECTFKVIFENENTKNYSLMVNNYSKDQINYIKVTTNE